MKYFAYTVILIIAVAIVAGFFIIGSPGEERLRRFDMKRIESLQIIQNEILTYWQNKETLPENLAVLNDDIRGFTVPRDPQTGQPFDYEIKSDLTFKLCANFNHPSRGQDTGASGAVRIAHPIKAPYPAEPYYFGTSSWDHEAGYVCFERTIDKDLYNPP